ncbi:hypothetical protein AAMO2058_000965500 [Amorphochlora amoebiformis]
MPHVYIIGEITGASGFDQQLSLQGEFKFVTSDKWQCLGGDAQGTTWVGEAEMDEDMSIWNHPIQIHYSTRGMYGWPKLRIQVNTIDDEDRVDLAGYGFCHVPMSPGTHSLDIVTTRPKGSFWDHISCDVPLHLHLLAPSLSLYFSFSLLTISFSLLTISSLSLHNSLPLSS